MALKIRRGTEAERAALTGINPALGEPIFVTDTGKLWIGDGVTTGGVQINPNLSIQNLTDVEDTLTPANGQVLQWNTPNARWQAETLSIAQTLNDLTNVDAVTGVATNKVLKYDATANGGAGGWVAGDEAFLSFDLDAQLASKSIDNLGDVSVSGSDTPTQGQYLIWDNARALFVPGDLDLAGASITNLTADIKGSVFGDDSTLLVDAVNSKVIINNGQFSVTGDTLLSTQLEVNISGPTETDDTVLNVWNSDESSAVRINSLNGATSANISGMTLNGYYGGFPDSGNEVKVTAGNYIGEISATAFDPDFGTFGTKVLSSVILFRTDPNGTIADDQAPGQIEFITNAGTNTTPVPKLMVLDSQGQLAINRTSARSTIDIEGVMTLEPQAAAPSTPVIGMIAVANKTNWDPASYSGSTPYPVFWTGSAWVAMIA